MAGVVIMFWPLAIEQHSDGSPSVLGWVLFGVWVPIGLVIAGGLLSLRDRSTTKGRTRR